MRYRPALPLALAVGIMLALLAAVLATAGVAAAGGTEPWAESPVGAQSVQLPPGTDRAEPASVAPRFRQVSAGNGHTCGVLTDGEVACWGTNEHGEATPPSGAFRQVSAGSDHSCGVRTSGDVACWGRSNVGQATPSGTFQQVSVGGYDYDTPHSCGVQASGTVVCWNAHVRDTPPGGTFQQVSAGEAHNCGVKTGGEVVCWGGSPSDLNYITPPNGTFEQVSAGYAFLACGIRTVGEAVCWGPFESDYITPPSGTFEQVSAGYGHICGVRTGGAVACWGIDDDGQATPPGGTFAQVSAGGNHTCGLRTDGTVACWGNDDYGQATPPSTTDRPWPDPVVAGDYDADNDGLIEISTLAQLDAIRYHPDGDGDVAYTQAFSGAVAGMGCPTTGCTGYELTANLDFDTNGNGRADAGDAYWNDGAGWDPIGAFATTFEGNRHTIANLYVKRSDAYLVGLFAWTSSNAVIRQIGLVSADVSGGNDSGNVGSLVGKNSGTVSASYATGDVSACDHINTDDNIITCPNGGLVGINASGGRITTSYATVNVSGGDMVGGLVGDNSFGTIAASYATGDVSSPADGGGLVGHNDGAITASYATGSVSGSGMVGGLVGLNFDASITDSYATGSVSGDYVGGLVGRNYNATVANSYWDTETSGQDTSDGGVGKTTAEMQSPTNDNPGIYATWDAAVWDFGTSNQYPTLRNVGTGVPTPVTGRDYDADDDGLIEISNLAQLDAIRYDLDGDGDVAVQRYVAYTQAFTGAAAGMGCPAAGCTGYELTANLDFDTNGNGRADAGDAYWNGGAGWEPIGNWNGPFNAVFDGVGHTISNLYISFRYQTDLGVVGVVGLFGNIGSSGVVKQVGLLSVSVTAPETIYQDYVGSLIGFNHEGNVTAAFATGSIYASGGYCNEFSNSSSCTKYAYDSVGGLVGMNLGTISASYASVSVSSGNYSKIGGLVGDNFPHGTINASYATGRMLTTASMIGSGDQQITIGGLVGYNSNMAGIVDSYWDTETSGRDTSAGGVGKTTAELQSPTNQNPGIYATWDATVWDFGTSSQYPRLRGLGQPGPRQPAPAPPLGNPTNLRATVAGSGQVNLTWEPASNADTHWIFRYKVSNGAETLEDTLQVSGTTASATVTGLEDGQSYVFVVIASRGVGSETQVSQPSNRAPVTLPTDQPPPDPLGKPTNVAAIVVGSEVTVTWTDAPGAVRHLAMLLKADFSGAPLSGMAAGSSHTFSGVPAGSYIAVVVAFDASGKYQFGISAVVTVGAPPASEDRAALVALYRATGGSGWTTFQERKVAHQ